MGRRGCIIEGCNSVEHKTKEEIRFYLLQRSDPNVYSHWLTAISVLNNQDVSNHSKTAVLCSKHFTHDCFMNGVYNNLNTEAIPSIFPKNENMQDVEYLLPEGDIQMPLAELCTNQMDLNNVPSTSTATTERILLKTPSLKSLIHYPADIKENINNFTPRSLQNQLVHTKQIMMNYHHPGVVEAVLNLQPDAMEDVESHPETNYTKCGEILVSKSGNFLYLCKTCNITLSNIQLFSEHSCVKHIFTNSNNDSEILQNEMLSTKIESSISSSESPHIEDHTYSMQQVNIKSRKKIRFSGTTKSEENTIKDINIKKIMNEINHACHFCGKTFKLNTTLMVHTRTHTGERPFDCPHCPSKFRSKSSLVLHIRTHTGEKPYFCTYCCKSFNGKSNLYVHERIHTYALPYQCDYCDKKFNHKSAQVTHEKKKHSFLHLLTNRKLINAKS